MWAGTFVLFFSFLMYKGHIKPTYFCTCAFLNTACSTADVMGAVLAFKIQWNPTLWPTHKYSHLGIMATLFWSKQKLTQLFSYLKKPFNTATPLTQPDFYDQSVTGLTGFHCTIYIFFHFEIRSLILNLTINNNYNNLYSADQIQGKIQNNKKMSFCIKINKTNKHNTAKQQHQIRDFKVKLSPFWLPGFEHQSTIIINTEHTVEAIW